MNTVRVLADLDTGEILCMSNNDEILKDTMYQQLSDGGYEYPEDMFESRNWGEFEFVIYEYCLKESDDVQIKFS